MAEQAIQLRTVSNSYVKRSKQLKTRERNKRWMMIGVTSCICVFFVGLILFFLFKSDGGNKNDNNPMPEPIDPQQSLVMMFDMDTSSVRQDSIKFLQL